MTMSNVGTCTDCDAPLAHCKQRKYYICTKCKKVSSELTTRQRQHPLSNLLGCYREGLEYLKKKL